MRAVGRSGIGDARGVLGRGCGGDGRHRAPGVWAPCAFQRRSCLSWLSHMGAGRALPPAGQAGFGGCAADAMRRGREARGTPGLGSACVPAPSRT